MSRGMREGTFFSVLGHSSRGWRVDRRMRKREWGTKERQTNEAAARPPPTPSPTQPTLPSAKAQAGLGVKYPMNNALLGFLPPPLLPSTLAVYARSILE